MTEPPIELIYKAVMGVVIAYGLYRVKTLEKKVDDAVTRDEVKERINSALLPYTVDLSYIKENISEIKKDLKQLVKNSNRSD